MRKTGSISAKVAGSNHGKNDLKVPHRTELSAYIKDVKVDSDSLIKEILYEQ